MNSPARGIERPGSTLWIFGGSPSAAPRAPTWRCDSPAGRLRCHVVHALGRAGHPRRAAARGRRTLRPLLLGARRYLDPRACPFSRVSSPSSKTLSPRTRSSSSSSRSNTTATPPERCCRGSASSRGNGPNMGLSSTNTGVIHNMLWIAEDRRWISGIGVTRF